MNELDLIFYLLSHPEKIDEFQFRSDYIKDKLVSLKIYEVLKPVCLKYQQLPPKSEILVLLDRPMFINIKDKALNTIELMYSVSADKVGNTSENDMDFYVKQKIFQEQANIKLSAFNQLQNKVQDHDITKEQLVSYIDKSFQKIDYCFQGTDQIKVYTDIFDEDFLIPVKEEQVKTLIPDMDLYMNGGFLKKTISALQAGTGKGKTTMLVSLAANCLISGYNVGFINLEMKEQELQYNIYSALQDSYSYREIKNNYNVDNQEFVKDLRLKIQEKIKGKFTTLKNNSFKSLNCQNIENYLTQIEEDEGFKFDIVFIDYIGLMSPYLIEKTMDRSDQMAQRTMREFKIMCERNNWAGVTATQTNRIAVKYEGKMSAENPNSNPMNYVSNSYAQTFELDNFISFERVQDTDLVKIQFCKSRQWHEIDAPKPFMMKYNAKQKRYVNTDEQPAVEDLNYKNIIDILHDKMVQKDLVDLCIKYGYCGEATVKKYYAKKNYKAVKNVPRVDIEGIDNLSLFVESMKQKTIIELGLTCEDIEKTMIKNKELF